MHVIIIMFLSKVVINMERIFFHGTGDSDYGFENMLKIICSGGIKSLKLQGSDYWGLVNGRDYISVCAWDDNISHKVEDLQSAFNGWIFGCPVFIISGDINAIKCGKYHRDYDANIERVSQYKDEWHVKDIIPLDKIIGIALPFKDEEFISANKPIVDLIMEFAKEYEWIVLECDNTLIDNTKKLLKNNSR